jgi:hypothetical protein
LDAIVVAAAVGGGGKDNAGSSGLGPKIPFVLERTDCHVSLSLSGAGRMLTLEVLLHASFVVTLSSKSAALVIVPFIDGVGPAAASAAREVLEKGYRGTTQMPFVRQCGWGSRPS